MQTFDKCIGLVTSELKKARPHPQYLLFGRQHGERRRVQQIARQTAKKQQRPIANVDDEIAHQQRVETAVGAAKVRGVLEVQVTAADARMRTLSRDMTKRKRLRMSIEKSQYDSDSSTPQYRISYQTDRLHGAKQDALKVVDILSERARLERRRTDLKHLQAGDIGESRKILSMFPNTGFDREFDDDNKRESKGSSHRMRLDQNVT